MARALEDFREWTPRQVVLATLVIAGIILGLFLIYWFRFVLFALFTAILLSTAIRPASEWLQKVGLPRSISTALVFLILLILVIAFFVGLVPIFSEAGNAVVESLRQYYNNIRTALIESPSALVRRFAYSLPWIFTNLPAGVSQNNDVAISQAVSFAGQVIQFVLVLMAVLLLTFFWSLERERAIRSVLRFFPTSNRQQFHDFFLEMERGVGAYLRGVLILCVVVGTMAFIAYMIIGLPNAVFLGLVAGIMEAIPMVGPLLGAIPAVLVALMFAPDKVVWVFVIMFIIQTAENYLLVPRVMRHAAGVNGFVTLLALAAFGSIFGLAGALLAIPIAVVIQMVLNRVLLDPAAISKATPGGRDYASKLRYEAQELVQDIRKLVRNKEDELDQSEDEVEEAIEVLANDLDSILAGISQISEAESQP